MKHKKLVVISVTYLMLKIKILIVQWLEITPLILDIMILLNVWIMILSWIKSVYMLVVFMI